MADIITPLWQAWLWFAAAAFSIVTIFIALVYVLGSMLMNDKMKGWARMELFELFYSVIIVVFGIGAIGTIDAAVQGAIISGGGITDGCGASITETWVKFTLPDGTQQHRCRDICGDEIAALETSPYHGINSCHMRLGIWLLHSIFSETSDFAMDVYISYLKYGMLQELSVSFQFLFEKAGVFSISPWRGFVTVGNVVRTLSFDWAIKIMMLTKFQEIILRFIAIAMFPAFFVSGAILRTFTFTRRLGGLMLAMAIALYFIFPAFYAFGALVALDIKNKARPAWEADTKANPHGLKDPPIANSIYATGSVTMIGGNVEVDEIHREYQRMEGLSEDDYFREMEQGTHDPNFDMSVSEDLAPPDDDEKRRQAGVAFSKTKEMIETFSKKSKMDEIIEFAWEPNGPLDSLARLTFFSIFFSLFGLFATISGIRSLSMTFGGDLELAGLTRLI